MPYWRAIRLSTLNACPGMAKLFVIRCVVPLMVMTPMADTTTQKRATSALWRSTKRVSAGIGTSEFRCWWAIHQPLASLALWVPPGRPAPVGTCRYHRGIKEAPATPGGVAG